MTNLKPTTEARQIILDFLKSKPGQQYSVQDIKKYLNEHASQPMTEGNVAGALNNLIKSKKNGVENVERGFYLFNPMLSIEEISIDELTPKVITILGETIEKIQEEVNSINPLEIETTDIPKLQKIRQLIETIEKLKNELN